MPTGPLTALGAGDESEARAVFAAWVNDILPLVPELMLYAALHYISLLAFRLDTLTGVEELVDYAERFPGELLGTDAGLQSAADAVRGRFAAVAGNLDEAVHLLEAGNALHVRLDLAHLNVESSLDLGIVLLRRDLPGDRDRARELLAATAQLASDRGMAPAVADARALLA